MMNTLNSKKHVPGAFSAKYDLGKKLGEGNFAVVHEALSKKEPGVKFAAKLIDKKSFNDEKHLNMFRNEVELMSSLNNPHVVQLIETFEDDKYFYLVMEMIQGGELFDMVSKIKKYSEKDAAKGSTLQLALAFGQIVRAIEHLQENRIVHRDLKPENLLLLTPSADADVKVADFGLATIIKDHELLFDAVGTPNYIAPEILLCLEEEPEGYGVEVDMWSAGVILYILLCGFPPFFAEDDEELYDSIIDGNYKFLKPWWDEISDQAKDLVEHLLCTDPDARYTPQQVFAHPWMSGQAPDKELSATQEELRKFNAKRRWKSAILTVVATNRFKTMMDMKKVREAKPRKAKNLRLSSVKNLFKKN